MKWIKFEKGKDKNTVLAVRQYNKKTMISNVFNLFFDGPLAAKRYAADMDKDKNLDHDFCIGTLNWFSEPLDISRVEMKERAVRRTL